MDQELFERVSRRCVGHEDDPVALTKGEVRQLVDWFNKDRDGLAAQLAELTLQVDRWQKEASTWKTLHDQNLEMARAFDEAEKKFRP